MDLLIKRFGTQVASEFVQAGTFGELFMQDLSQGYTVEQPWMNNQRFESCVPDGEYTLIPFDSPRYGRVFVMVNPELNVYAFEEECLSDTDRFLCLFVHRGSYPENFQGCIGLGERLNENINGQTWAANTKTACGKLMNTLERTEHKLTIMSVGGATPAVLR